MLNRIIITPVRTGTQFVTREVHEHRAPTDESVKLLREMEAKAQAQIDKAVAVSGNGFECVVQSSTDFMSDRFIVRSVFSLNGIRMVAEFSGPRAEAAPDLMMEGLRSAVADKIALAVLLPAFRALPKF